MENGFRTDVLPPFNLRGGVWVRIPSRAEAGCVFQDTVDIVLWKLMFSPLSSLGLRWRYLARTLIYICMGLLYDMCHMVTVVGSVKNILLKYS